MFYWFTLNVGDMDLHLKIEGFSKDDGKEWSDNWCRVTYSLIAEPWLDYHINAQEILLSCEVMSLADDIGKLLNDEFDAPEEVSFIEPDFEFRLYPKEDLRKNPKYTYIREGCEIKDIYARWETYFWSRAGLTGNCMSVRLNRKKLERLLNYLNLVVGKLKPDSETITEMIKDGHIYG